MDIVSSTRLSILYPLEEVYRIKNAFIRAAIEIVSAFDGHVHRIMGDAVMAYFGGKKVEPEVAVVDALNCASVLMYFAKKLVKPMLDSEYNDAFGIRVGIDFGRRDDVMWSSYGYPGVDEVTATSFYVDVASKLQHSAGTNQIMIGESLRSLIDFPTLLLNTKKVIRNGETQEQVYLQPNHADKGGRPKNYKQHVLSWETYLEASPIAQVERSFLPTTKGQLPGIKVSAYLHKSKDTPPLREYTPSASITDKEMWIRFLVDFPEELQFPLTVQCSVENHGDEARTLGGETHGDHSRSYEIQDQNDVDEFEHWESTRYRGFHYLIVELKAGDKSFYTRFGVYVK